MVSYLRWCGRSTCALDHELQRFGLFRHSERACIDAVGAGNAARSVGAMHDPKLVFLNRIGGADFGAGRVFAVHANLDAGLRGSITLDVINTHHRRLPVCFALGARHFACVAADATLWVHEKLFFLFELKEHGRLGVEVRFGDRLGGGLFGCSGKLVNRRRLRARVGG